jgi:hypothetical protein
MEDRRSGHSGAPSNLIYDKLEGGRYFVNYKYFVARLQPASHFAKNAKHICTTDEWIAAKKGAFCRPS